MVMTAEQLKPDTSRRDYARDAEAHHHQQRQQVGPQDVYEKEGYGDAEDG
jgi:hypothetical protein